MKNILVFFIFFVSFLDYCLLRFSGELDRELSDQMQIEFLKKLQEAR